MKRHRAGKLAVALIMALFLAFTWSAVCAADQATPLLPASYYGQVFVEKYGGELLRESAVVTVYLAGDETPRGTPMTVINGWYGGPGGEDPKYKVTGTTADQGKRVLFYVNGIEAKTYVAGTEKQVIFQEGDVLQVDLVIPDTTPPVLTRTKPATLEALPYHAADYTDGTVFEWTANEDLNTAAQPAATFTAAGAARVSGKVTFPDARTVWVVPDADLLPGTAYTLTVTGIKDKAGNETQIQVQFTTIAQATLPEGTTISEALPLTFAGGAVEVTLPPGTVLESGASLEANPVHEPPAVPADLRVAGQVVNFTAQGINLPPGAKWQIKLKASADAKNPAIYYYNESSKVWEAVPGSTYDRETGFVTAEVEHLSIYGVLEAIVNLQELKVEPSSLTLKVGETKQLVVKAVYSDGTEADVTNEATYASANENVATVEAGLITAVGAGETVVTATYGDKSAQATVTVQALPAGPAPVVEAINPVVAIAGKPDQTITVTGQNFQEGALVVLCQEHQEVATIEAVYSSATELAFTVPTSLAPGFYMVMVRNPDGQQSAEHINLTLYAGEAPQVQVFPGIQGTQPGQIQAGGGVRVEVPVKVARAYDSALVVVRVDDPDGRPMLAAVEGPLPANTTVKFSASFNLPDKAGTYTVKAFVWDGWQTMNVLTPAYEGTFEAVSATGGGGGGGEPQDTTPPTVISTDPQNGSADVPVDTTMSVTFSEPVVQGDRFAEVALVEEGGTAVQATVSLSGATLIVDPASDLKPGARYTLTVPAGAVKDAAGNALEQAYILSFTTKPQQQPAGLELKVENVTGAPGSRVEVPIILSSQGEVAAIEFVLAYGADLLTYQSVQAGQLISTWAIDGNVVAPGKVRVIAYHPTLQPAPSGSGTVAVLTFQVANGATSGASCDLMLQNVVLSDANGVQLSGVNAVNGRFTVQ